MIPVFSHTLAGAVHNAETAPDTVIVCVKLSEQPAVVTLYLSTVAPEPVKLTTLPTPNAPGPLTILHVPPVVAPLAVFQPSLIRE